MSIKEQPNRSRGVVDATPTRPMILLPFGNVGAIEDAVRSACPDLRDVCSPDIDEDRVEDSLSSLGVALDEPFCLTSRLEKRFNRQFLTPEQRYPQGFPLYHSSSALQQRIYLAGWCLSEVDLPSWLPDVAREAKRRERDGTFAPSLITAGQAAQYAVFVRKLYDAATARYDGRLVEQVLFPEPDEILDALYPSASSVRVVTIFSGAAIEPVLDKVANDQYEPCGLDPDLHRGIEDNFSFWVRSGGVIAEEVLGF